MKKYFIVDIEKQDKEGSPFMWLPEDVQVGNVFGIHNNRWLADGTYKVEQIKPIEENDYTFECFCRKIS